ncbi:hypothetical protein P280DRAFT_230163 [Massarina eburnea CBS 473.64]|uniref:Uncharacterized protein n=1 Tax=Massarina eburnea CBS 473.64 TaxID=1395130 RepID=A0A6A6S8Y4_9PLEO|nr:hypothetical protein P280DRAFT_230163 [Massarina eburnea CBS 473.64]
MLPAALSFTANNPPLPIHRTTSSPDIVEPSQSFVFFHLKEHRVLQVHLCHRVQLDRKASSISSPQIVLPHMRHRSPRGPRVNKTSSKGDEMPTGLKRARHCDRASLARQGVGHNDFQSHSLYTRETADTWEHGELISSEQQSDCVLHDIVLTRTAPARLRRTKDTIGGYVEIPPRGYNDMWDGRWHSKVGSEDVLHGGEYVGEPSA